MLIFWAMPMAATALAPKEEVKLFSTRHAGDVEQVLDGGGDAHAADAQHDVLAEPEHLAD